MEDKNGEMNRVGGSYEGRRKNEKRLSTTKCGKRKREQIFPESTHEA